MKRQFEHIEVVRTIAMEYCYYSKFTINTSNTSLVTTRMHMNKNLEGIATTSYTIKIFFYFSNHGNNVGHK